MASPQKYFIITSGPTGSGKTKLVNATLKQLGLDEHTPYTKLLIDDLVEQNNIYKGKVTNIIENIDTTCHENNGCVKGQYNSPSNELLKKFSNAYWNVRTKSGCKTINRKGKVCNDILMNKLRDIQTTKPTVVVFETVGNKMPWILLNKNEGKRYIPEDYKIIVSYSLVNVESLKKRITSRTYTGIKSFTANHTQSAPRLVPLKGLDNTVTQIKATILALYSKCIQSYDRVTCGDSRIDTLLLFDNNGDNHTVIYDSDRDNEMTPDILERRVNSALGILSGGRIHTTRVLTKKYRNRYRQKSRRLRQKKYPL